jgi:hypothetical protein
MLVKLTIHSWDAFAKDNNAAKTVDTTYATAGSVGNYNKRLFDRKVLSPMTKVLSQIYSEHRRLTLPWCYDGISLLPSKLYFEYTGIMREKRDLLNAAVSNFATHFPLYISNEQQRLGKLFDVNNYPASSELPHKWGFDTQFFPVPDSGHFVVDLEASEAQKIRDEMDGTIQQAQQQAQNALRDRVHELLTHAYDRLQDPENIFRDSLVDNIFQLSNNLPLLNVFNDELITEVNNEIRERVLTVSPEDLRTDLAKRELVAFEAFRILQKLNKGA